MINKALFSKIPHLELLKAISKVKKIDIWLVGGFLRDNYLKKNNIANKKYEFCDFDFCVAKNTLDIVKQFSSKTSSKFIVLDQFQQSYRVIVKIGQKIYTYDFTALRGKDIYADLSLRDFSINALAVNISDTIGKLIDCFNGRQDMHRQKIKVIAENVLRDDPLRILRGFAFMVSLNFCIEPKTLKYFAKYKHLLKKVSAERINEELFKIFASENSYAAIKLMDKLRIIDEIIPYINKTRGVTQGGYHHLDVWRHSLEALYEFEFIYKNIIKNNKNIFAYVNQELAANRRYMQIMKLACLVHDVGKPRAKKRKGKKTIFYMHEKIGRDLAEKIALSLKLSFREKEVLKKIVFWHLRPGYLADQEPPSKKAIYRFFRDTEDEGVAVILVSLADWRATRGILTDNKKRKKHEKIMIKLVKDYFVEKDNKPLPRIIDGYEIMRKFNIGPSPLVGKILMKVREEQVLKKISTKSQAYIIAARLMRKDKIRNIANS